MRIRDSILLWCIVALFITIYFVGMFWTFDQVGIFKPQVNEIVPAIERPLIEPFQPLLVECKCSCGKVDAPEEVNLRYGFTEDDIYLLAQLLCGDKATDGDGEYDIDYQTDINYHELSKVFCVVMNRQRDERFPDTIKDIVLARNQFSVFPENLNTTPSEKALREVRYWCEAYDKYDGGVQCIPENHIYFSGDGNINHTRSE